MTAVEWLVEQLDLNVFESDEEVEGIIDKAKEMEKEQKKFIFECGRNFQLTGEGTFEEVFNETFKSE
jgi:hypothetical protein